MADITFTGNLAADARPGYTRGGSPVLNFRVGDSKSRKLDGGGYETVAQNWFNVELWGSIAEFLADQLLKGVRVKVYGQFYVREYNDNQGTPRTSLDVKASAVEVLTSYKDRQKIADQPDAQDDPWATPAVYNGGGWGNGPGNEPPF